MGERPPLQRCSARGQCEIPKHDSYLSCHTNQPMSALTCLLDRRRLFAKCKLRAKISSFAQTAATLPHPHPWTIPGRAAARAGALGKAMVCPGSRGRQGCRAGVLRSRRRGWQPLGLPGLCGLAARLASPPNHIGSAARHTGEPGSWLTGERVKFLHPAGRSRV